jgi:hypothetical protein
MQRLKATRKIVSFIGPLSFDTNIRDPEPVLHSNRMKLSVVNTFVDDALKSRGFHAVVEFLTRGHLHMVDRGRVAEWARQLGPTFDGPS